MKKSLLGVVGLIISCGCQLSTPQNFTTNFGGIPIEQTATFSSIQGGTDRKVLNVCGQDGFNGEVSISLENAPVGVSLVSPNPSKLQALDCATLLPINQNFILGVSSSAPLGDNKPFQVVVSSNSRTQKLSAAISITVSPLMTGRSRK